jgi:fructose-bisphosphate aldolase, class I
LFEAPGIEQYISGVIMFDETVRDTTKEGKKFCELLNERGILCGIKVDTGVV